MTDRLREAVRRPLPLACHPLYRFYDGGSLTRSFAGNDDPRGQPQALPEERGSGTLEGDFGSHPVRRGETFALPASLAFRVRAGAEPVRAIRCLGPGEAAPTEARADPRD